MVVLGAQVVFGVAGWMMTQRSWFAFLGGAILVVMTAVGIGAVGVAFWWPAVSDAWSAFFKSQENKP